MFSPGKSIFLFAPPLLLAVYGLPKLWRKNRGLATLAAGLPVVGLLFYARYTQWEGGYCYGPRYLVPALSLLLLGFGPVFVQAGKKTLGIAVALIIAGLFVQSIGLATSFLQGETHTGYYDEHWNYRLGQSSIVSQTRLLLRYATTPNPAPLGLGWDRWFVFLAKGGVSKLTLTALAALMVAVTIASGATLRRALPAATGPANLG